LLPFRKRANAMLARTGHLPSAELTQ